MDKNKIQKELIVFVCQNFMVEEDEFTLDESLIDQGIIDSFGLVEISTYIQKNYSYSVKDDEMIRDNFGSINKLVDYIFRSTGA